MKKLFLFCLLVGSISASAVTVMEGESSIDGTDVYFTGKAEHVANNILGTPSCSKCQEYRNMPAMSLYSATGTFIRGQPDPASPVSH